MKNYKISLFFIALAMLVVCVPVTNAQTSISTHPTASASTAANNFCSTFQAGSQTYLAHVSTAVANVQKLQTAESSRIQANRTKLDATVKQRQIQDTQSRAKIYANLTTKAGTNSAELAAVTAFQNTVEAAVKARQGGVAAAVSTYRQSFDQTALAHKQALTSAAEVFQTSMQTAVSAALSACTAGTDSQTVYAAWQQSLTSAKTVRTTAMQQSQNVSAQLGTLAQIRNTAVQAADAAYKTVIANASTTLKTAFGQSATAPTSASTTAPTTTPTNASTTAQ